MIRAGLLRTPVIILGSTPYVDDLGGEAYSFTPKFTTKAQVTYKANDIQDINELLIGLLTAEVKMRAYHDIQPEDILNIGGVFFDILNMYDLDNVKHIEVVERHG